MAAAEEARFSRRKHDSRFPLLAIDFCLRQAGIGREDLSYVVFYEKPFVKFERILMTTLGTFPHSCRLFRESMIALFKEKLWIKSLIRERVHVPDGKILFVDHHLSHAASAFFCSPFEKAAVVTIDGVGEWTTASIGYGEAAWAEGGQNLLRLVREMRFPHSLGLLYSAFTAFLGFEVNEGEYKVMGMAPYGERRYMDKIYKMVHPLDDGSFWLDMDYFVFHQSTHRTFSAKFEELFGRPRDPQSEFTIDPEGSGPDNDRGAASSNQYYADVAASIQGVTEDLVLRMVNQAYRETGLKKLCMAGGVALNSVANGRVLAETPFEEIYIQPAAGDAGGALGAALYVHHVLLGELRTFTMEHAYWGKGYEAGEIRQALDEQGVRYTVCDNAQELTARVVNDLTDGKVIGWFQGRFEWGPRALGNRSIIADPRRADMKEIVNRKIKFREPFRPFAPAIPEEKTAQWFNFDVSAQYPARFMLLVVPFRPGQAALVPGVNHQGTGRLQTVRREWNPLYYDVIDQFGQATGVPVIMNTSFNLRGEPIVTSPSDALSTFYRSGLDTLVLDRHVVSKEQLR